MLPGEHQQVLSNLQSRFEDFLEDSQESQIFSGADITQLEKEVNVCKQYYQELLKSAERGNTRESLYPPYPPRPVDYFRLSVGISVLDVLCHSLSLW